MPRYRLTLEYDGGPFVGWQRQDEGASVQGALEDAIEKLSGERVTVTGAGRTDAGVHALGQVAHFDLEKTFEPGKVRDALNHYLRPDPVVGAGCAERGRANSMPAFPPRRGIICSAFSTAAARRRWKTAASGMCRIALDADAMHAAAQFLVGPARFHHLPRRRMPGPVAGQDPGPAGCQPRAARKSISRPRRAPSCITRSAPLPARLKLVGEGKWPPRDVKKALEARDRSRMRPGLAAGWAVSGAGGLLEHRPASTCRIDRARPGTCSPLDGAKRPAHRWPGQIASRPASQRPDRSARPGNVADARSGRAHRWPGIAACGRMRRLSRSDGFLPRQRQCRQTDQPPATPWLSSASRKMGAAQHQCAAAAWWPAADQIAMRRQLAIGPSRRPSSASATNSGQACCTTGICGATSWMART